MNELSIQDMRQLLREKGLNSRGSKKQLQSRLAELYSLEACTNSSSSMSEEKNGKGEEKKLRITITKQGTAKSTSMLLTLNNGSMAAAQSAKLFQLVLERAANKFRFKAKCIFLQTTGEEVLHTNFLDLVHDGTVMIVTAGQPLQLSAAQKSAITAAATTATATAATQSPSQSPSLSPQMSPQSPALLGTSLGGAIISNDSGSHGSPLLQASPLLPPRVVPFSFGQPLIGPSTCSSASISSCDSQTSQSALFSRSSPSLSFVSTPYSPQSASMLAAGFASDSELRIDSLDLNEKSGDDESREQKQGQHFRLSLFETPKNTRENGRVIFQSSYQHPAAPNDSTISVGDALLSTPVKGSSLSHDSLMVGVNNANSFPSSSSREQIGEAPSQVATLSASAAIISSSLSNTSPSTSAGFSSAPSSAASGFSSSSASSSSNPATVPPAWFTSINRENSSILINLLHNANAAANANASASAGNVAASSQISGTSIPGRPSMLVSFSQNGAVLAPFNPSNESRLPQPHAQPLSHSLPSAAASLFPIPSAPPALLVSSSSTSAEVPPLTPSPSIEPTSHSLFPSASSGSVSVERDRRLKKYEADLKQLRRELSAANDGLSEVSSLRQTVSQRESKIHELMATVSKQEQTIGKLQKERDRLKEKNSTLSSEMSAQRTLAKEYALVQAKLKEITAQYELLTVPLSVLAARKPSIAECQHILRMHTEGVSRIQSYIMEGLEREAKIIAEKRQCRVCMDQEISVLLLPCSHYVLCAECAEKVQLCPICRCRIDDRKPVYS